MFEVLNCQKRPLIHGYTHTLLFKPFDFPKVLINLLSIFFCRYYDRMFDM